jgi:pre-mRNA-splicing factor ATP-dependent RNA helicase DHX16
MTATAKGSKRPAENEAESFRSQRFDSLTNNEAAGGEEKIRKRQRRQEETAENNESETVQLESFEDEEARRERERLTDLRDRDAFSERVRNYDRAKTKKIVEDRSSKSTGAAAEAAHRRMLADDPTARSHALPSLRQHSRQEYLTKREIQQIELLRKEIEDDEVLFHDMKISKREKRDLERKKDLLKLVEARLKINDKWDGYQLPEDYFTEQGKIDKKKKEKVLYQRYDEAKPKGEQFVTDIDQWEASQTHNSSFRTGSMDKRETVDEYEYVFDESQTIQFVLDSTMGEDSKLSPADKLLQSQIDAAENRGE